MSFGDSRQLVYHVVINPKYRHKFLAERERAAFLETVIRSLCEKLGITILAMAIKPDHVHLLLDLPTSHSVAKTMQNIKWWTSVRMRSHYPDLKVHSAFWSRRYFVRMVAASGDQKTVSAYIKKQGWTGNEIPGKD